MFNPIIKFSFNEDNKIMCLSVEIHTDSYCYIEAEEDEEKK
jgi:hypothetical protein